MKKIIFATSNEGKMKEIRALLSDLPYQVLSMKEARIQLDIVEDGTTFEANALIKARAVAEEIKRRNEEKRAAEEEYIITMADDSGLEVDYMNREPGVYSARFMGEDTSYDIKNQAILDCLTDVPDEQRTARFVCAIACVWPEGKSEVTRGTVEGIIGYRIEGTNGFGYDPIFYLPEYGCTTAQMPPEQKNKVSHRANAVLQMKQKLQQSAENHSKS